jgi:site-specific recombinase XerD
MTKLGNSTLFGLIHDYLKLYLPKQRKLSPNTVRSYREALELLVDFVKEKKRIPLQDVTFEMLTAEMLCAYLDYLENERNCSISTRNNRLAAVRAFLEYTADRDVTTVITLKEIKKVPTKKPNEIEVVDYMSLAAVTAIIEQTDASTPKGFRDRFFLLLMYDTAARIQEMIDINLCDFQINKTPTVMLRGKGSKSRPVPLMEKTVECLKKYLSIFHSGKTQQEQRLFYTVSHEQRHPLSASCIRQFLKQYASSARANCIEVPENVHPHLFRHSRAMHLYQNGMDLTLLSQWLGHANLETTQIYAHADTEHKRKAVAAATSSGNPLNRKLSPERFTVSDEDTLKRLTGLR